MIQVILFSSRQEELSEIRRQMGVVSFRFPRVESELQGTADLSQWQEWGRQNGVDALICDVGVDGAVNALEAVKQWNPQALVFPIAGIEVPPTQYVKPEILPYALFWRPLQEGDVQETLRQLLSAIGRERPGQAEASFRVKSRQKVQYVPYGDILYFESWNKKLRLRTRHTELSFPGTLGQLEGDLPEQFLRCHRSYIVNRDYVTAVDQKEHLIELEGALCVPLSRGYRENFVEGSNETKPEE